MIVLAEFLSETPFAELFNCYASGENVVPLDNPLDVDSLLWRKLHRTVCNSNKFPWTLKHGLSEENSHLIHHYQAVDETVTASTDN